MARGGGRVGWGWGGRELGRGVGESENIVCLIFFTIIFISYMFTQSNIHNKLYSLRPNSTLLVAVGLEGAEHLCMGSRGKIQTQGCLTASRLVLRIQRAEIRNQCSFLLLKDLIKRLMCRIVASSVLDP